MKNRRFTFLCSPEERQILTVLAKHLRRSQGDTVRFVLIESAKECGLISAATGALTHPVEKLGATNG